MKNLFIFAGEKSGDLHGSQLVAALHKQNDALHIEGIAGPRMRAGGVDGPLKMEDFEVMGLTDVLLALPKLYRHFHAIRDHILKAAPAATILIDYPGFNLRLAQALRQKGYKGKIVQYVSPSVWAHGRQRIETMSACLDLLMTIYPFEAACFADTPLPVAFVGNPLQEYMAAYQYDETWQKKIQLPANHHLVALFPGSRQGEIRRNLPYMLTAAAALKRQHPEAVFGISCAHPETAAIVAGLLSPYPSELRQSCHLVPKEFSYELMRDSRCAVAKSGTVTLELALHRCPTIVLYALTRLNRLYAKYILKLRLPHYCIVNILAAKMVFPEFIETSPAKDSLLAALETIYADESSRREIMAACDEIAAALGSGSASTRAASAIAGLLTC